jgi:DnaJ-class molecular chaperone
MNPYRTLGVPPGATDAEIRKAFRRLTMEYHPDRNHGDAAAEERYKEIAVAYEILTNKDTRTQYDQTGTFDASNLDAVEIMNKVNEFLDAFGAFIDAGQVDMPPPRAKSKKKGKKGKKKVPKKPKRREPANDCRVCGGVGHQTFRQGETTFAVPCRGCRGKLTR